MTYRIGIIGAGTAGAASALYLKKMGHEPIVFEREKEPRPMGAGIMLQPTGLKCMYELGVGEEASKLGAPIHGMKGDNHEGKTVVDLSFENDNKLYGLGLHRTSLYLMLYNKVLSEGIELLSGRNIVAINGKDKKTLTDTENRTYENFDFVIVANGARSKLRKNLDIINIEEQQKYGALWAKIPYDNAVLGYQIRQFYEGSYKMVGFMPIGKLKDADQEFINFFWSIRMSDAEKWKDVDFDEWKKEVIDLCPEFKDVVDQIKSKDDLILAPYMDVNLRQPFAENILFLGDSAHPMSPQLSQGVSFALLDAKYFAASLAKHPDSLEAAFKDFEKNRNPQVNYYQTLSRFITPMFQSDAKRTWFRDLLFKLICSLKISRDILLGTILGYRKNYFSNIKKEHYVKN